MRTNTGIPGPASPERRPRIILLLLALASLFALAALPAAGESVPRKPAMPAASFPEGGLDIPAREIRARAPLTFMTWNLFFGFDDGALFAAAATGDMTQIAGAVSRAWSEIHATDFHVRAREIAKQVKAYSPDLVAVQEAPQYVLADGGTGEPMEVVDHLEILLAELRDAGLSYEVASSVDDTNVTLPDANGNFVVLQDRDAILVRTDQPPGRRPVIVSNAQHGTFENKAALCVAKAEDGSCALPLPILRGWASVDVLSRGKSFRFVCTHLEDAGEAETDPTSDVEWLQLFQAQELVSGRAFATALPIVLAGDFNSDAATGWRTYRFLAGPAPDGAALSDAWSVARPKEPGFTWGPSLDLLNPNRSLTQRLDLILVRGGLNVVNADVVGDKPGDRASNGLWPSDHAGLVVALVP